MAEENKARAELKADVSTNDSSSVSRSTGPRSPEGKERSKYNAVKHGIFSKVVVLEDEPRVAFDALLNGLLDDLRPQGALEEILVEKLATLMWRHRRLIVAHAAKSKSIEVLDGGGAGERWEIDHLLRYEAALERAFDRALSQLERLRRMRLGQPVPPPIKLDISSP